MANLPKRLVSVFGATGAQGGSVARALLRDVSGTIRVRGITRNPASDAATALADLGMEVVRADGADVKAMAVAFQDSWAVFVNTNSDDPALQGELGSTLTETKLGMGIVDAAVQAGVEHIVYSGMTSATEATDGKIAAKAFDEKHAIVEYALTKPFTSVVNVSPGWYMENFLVPDLAPIFGGFPHIPSSDGMLVFRTPLWGGSEAVPFISVASDFGDIVHGVLVVGPEKYHGKLVQGMSDSRTLTEVVADFTHVTGRDAKYEVMQGGPEEIETYGMSALVTVQDMFRFCKEAGGKYFGVENDVTTPQVLKKAAAMAQGLVGEDGGKLMTMEMFWKAEFVDNAA